MAPNRDYLKKGLNIVIDAQWGSTGKGKLCGFLGHEKPDLVASSFGPNAGHTYVDCNLEIVYRHLPSSAFTSGADVLILPDSVIEVEQFMRELETLPKGQRVIVHPRAAILHSADAIAAQATGRHLAGTMKGTGHAISRKILRIEGTKLAGDVLPAELLGDTSAMLQTACRNGKRVLVEVSQGFDLSVNHGTKYPYLTSRDVTVGGALNACGCPASAVGQVIGSMRTMPIRVGNVEGGWSGPHHHDHTELTWAEVTEKAGAPQQLCEITTVTKRVRRVFSFSINQLCRFVEYNEPSFMFLNFAQYLGWEMEDGTSIDDLSEPLLSFIANFESVVGVPVLLVGTGADNAAMVEFSKRTGAQT